MVNFVEASRVIQEDVRLARGIRRRSRRKRCWKGRLKGLARKVLELAKAGDLTALRLCLDRILPPRRERLLQFELPSLSSAADSPEAIAAITVAVSRGEITLMEATEMAKLVETFTRAFEAREIEERLRVLEDIQFLKKNRT